MSKVQLRGKLEKAQAEDARMKAAQIAGHFEQAQRAIAGKDWKSAENSIKQLAALGADEKRLNGLREELRRTRPKTAGASFEVCGLPLSGSREEMAQKYYIKGERLFANDEINSAKAALNTAICLNPEHKASLDFLQLLQQTYPSR
ncbi:MAG: hypothetical protein GY862_21970 [Gammaproteobacteria bacterium]|nr:hypothetical protein [Gammaproteobacteria bacterium]